MTPWAYIGPVVTFSVVYNLPRFFEWKTVTEVIEQPCYNLVYDNDTVDLNSNNNIGYHYEIVPNCSHKAFNVSLVPMALRLNEVYIAVSERVDFNFTINLT